MFFQTPRQPLFSGISKPMLSEFVRESDGHYVYAQLNPPRQSQTGGIENPMRILRTPQQTYLTAGDVIISLTGRKHLLIDNGEEEVSVGDMKSFKTVELDTTYPHLRHTETTDALTGRTISSETALEDIWVSETPMRDLEDSIRIPFTRADLLTGTEVLLGDIIGPYVVTEVNNRLGIYHLRVQAR